MNDKSNISEQIEFSPIDIILISNIDFEIKMQTLFLKLCYIFHSLVLCTYIPLKAMFKCAKKNWNCEQFSDGSSKLHNFSTNRSRHFEFNSKS